MNSLWNNDPVSIDSKSNICQGTPAMWRGVMRKLPFLIFNALMAIAWPARALYVDQANNGQRVIVQTAGEWVYGIVDGFSKGTPIIGQPKVVVKTDGGKK